MKNLDNFLNSDKIYFKIKDFERAQEKLEEELINMLIRILKKGNLEHIQQYMNDIINLIK